MHILALNTYHGGSHKAFLRHWQTHSRQRWTTLTLPARHWKWRMRHAAVYFAEQLQQINLDDIDLLLCTDMLNLAEFLGLAPAIIQTLPRIIYFHESQLDYPDQHATDKDLHYAFTNFTSALSATEVWFNSHWHKNTFHNSLQNWLSSMPDFQPLRALHSIMRKSVVQSPGIGQQFVHSDNSSSGTAPLVILWAARWEQDKNPRTFFAALRLLKQHGIDFRLNMLGAAHAQASEEFSAVRKEFSAHIDQWGYVENQQDYIAILKSSDIIVSSAHHEFFGIAVVEAVACGCIPLVPQRLAYPETLSEYRQHHPECFYDGSTEQLYEKLRMFASDKSNITQSNKYHTASMQLAQKYYWPRRATEMDTALQRLLGRP